MSYGIDPGVALTLEVRRIATEEIDAAIALLEAARRDPGAAVHKCRKRLKRLRGLLRLVRRGDREFFRAENGRYRDVSASLAGPREAMALIETVDRMAKRFPRESAGGRLDRVREALVARRQEALRDDAGLQGTIHEAVKACEAGRGALAALVLPDEPEAAADILAGGARAVMRRARKALDRARKSGLADDFHDLRKASKAHDMHLRLLRRLWPGSVKARRKTVDALGEGLGELNDVFVMEALVESDERPSVSRSDTALLRRLLRKSKRELRKQSLAAAADLYDASPKPAIRKFARKCRESVSESAAKMAR